MHGFNLRSRAFESEMTACCSCCCPYKVASCYPWHVEMTLVLEHGCLCYINVFAVTFGFGLDVQCRNLLGSHIKLRSICQVFPSTLANRSGSLFFGSSCWTGWREKAVLHIFPQPCAPGGGWLLMQGWREGQTRDPKGEDIANHLLLEAMS